MTIVLTADQNLAMTLGTSLFIEAGAGSGKTSVLIQRYLKILDEAPETEPRHIVVITFTNDAAHELKERLAAYVTNGQLKPFTQKKLLEGLDRARISTIHSFCTDIIRQHAQLLSLDPLFSVLENAESSFLIEDALAFILQSAGRSKHPSLYFCLSFLSRYKLTQHLRWVLSHPDVLDNDVFKTNSHDEDFQRLYFHHLKLLGNIGNRYLSKLKRDKAVLFFDDLIPLALKAVEHSECLKQVQADIHHLMIDEFQDTDQKQWALIEKISDPFSYKHKHFIPLCLVGDVKQSIYRFRQADARQFLAILSQFDQHPQTSVVRLRDNFRTCSLVLSGINAIFQHLFESDPEHIVPYTPLQAARLTHGSMTMICLDEGEKFTDEAQAMIATIRWILSENPQYTYSDIGILFRRASVFKPLETAFAKMGIPVQCSHQQGLFQKESVIDTYQLLRSIMQPYDPLSWIRVITSSFGGLTYDHVFWLKHCYPKLSIFEALTHLIAQKPTEIPSDIYDALRIFSKKASAWVQHCAFRAIPNVLRRIISETDFLKNLSTEQHEDISYYLDIIDTQFKNAKGNYHGFLEAISRLMASTESPQVAPSLQNAVQVMTIHASKGLEFPVVLLGECGKNMLSQTTRSIIRNENGLAFPLSDEGKTPYADRVLSLELDHAEQEFKRLFYVACTRAKDHLVMVGTSPKLSKTGSKTLTFFDFTKEHTAHFQLFSHISDIPIPDKLSDPKISLFAPPSWPQTEVSPIEAAPRLFHPGPSILKLSVSQAEAGLQCAKKARLFSIIQSLATDEEFKLKTPYIAETLHGARVGQCIHQLFYQSNLHPERSPSELLSSLKDISLEDSRFILEALTHFKTHPLYKHTSSPHALHEYPFLMRIEELVLEGRMDTAVQIDSIWHVIDYKTDAVSAEFVEDYSQKYYYQLGLYALALSLAFNLTEDIQGLLYFTQCQRTVYFTFSKQDRDTLKRDLQKIPNALFSKKFSPPSTEICYACPYYILDPKCPETIH